MVSATAKNSFQFVTQTSLIELTGLRAQNLYELLEHLKVVPDSVLYYHTHHFLKQHQFLSPEPPNDFAYWVTNVVQEDRLGEQLAAIDTVRFSSLDSLRVAIVGAVDRYLAKSKSTRTSPEGEEFHFMKARSFVIQTPHRANTLEEFLEEIQKISLNSLYFHMFESRLRLQKGTNDFSLWLETELGETALAKTIARLDPYTLPMDSLRQRIVRLIRVRLGERPKPAAESTASPSSRSGEEVSRAS
jgi:hypothetical protein